MKTLLATLFFPGGHRSRRRSRVSGSLRLGGELLEPRLALASAGTQAFLTLGQTKVFGPEPVTNIGNATSFVLENVVCTSSHTGVFSTVPLFPNPGALTGNWTFNTASGTNSSLTFTIPAYGTFTSTSIVTESNSPLGEQRTLYVTGNFQGAAVVPSPISAAVRISMTQTGLSISSSATLSVPAPTNGNPLVAATDAGCDTAPFVYVINPYTGVTDVKFEPYKDFGPFRSGVRVAVGNVDNDPSTLEIVTAPGAGPVGQVRVFRLDGTEIESFRCEPFGRSYTRGVEVAVGKINAGVIEDLVVGASRGAGNVNVYYSSGTTFGNGTTPRVPARSLTAFGGTYTGGATVAVGAEGEIVVGSGISLPPTVKVYDVSVATPTLISQFAPSVPTGTGGVSVTTQKFTAGAKPQTMVAGGWDSNSAIGVYQGDVNPPTNTYNTFASRPKSNVPVNAAAAALASSFADTIFMAQGNGGVGTILKVNAATGLVDPTFTPTSEGKPIISPLRLATRAWR
jgi:hypothetical protein